MSKLSIYENNWINIVFENRNKEYGAYQLRQDSLKTSMTALFMGLTLLTGIVYIVFLISRLHPSEVLPSAPNYSETIFKVTEIPAHKIEDKLEPIPITQQTKVENLVTKAQLVNPIVVASAVETPEIAKNIENVISLPSDKIGTVNLSTTNSMLSGNGTETAPITDTGNGIVGSTALDKLPEFPGGIEKFYKYVGSNFSRPEIETDNIFRIYVSFVIEKDGSMTDITVKNDPGYGLGKEAVRVLKSLKTKWKPGMINSKPVRTAYNLPIIIKGE